MQRIEHGKIGFAWNAEHRIDAMDLELIDQDLPAAAGLRRRHAHRPSH
ncbi:MAG: hypothetical protein K0S54_3299 [Alphaproteobacteria bacterium]|nr:hypothetical protein [Alphaproteobacteria bacterium]